MTSLKYLNLHFVMFNFKETCDFVLDAISLNQTQNPSLSDINLFCAEGEKEEHKFSPFALAVIADLRAKGLNIALTRESHDEMNTRYHDEP